MKNINFFLPLGSSQPTHEVVFLNGKSLSELQKLAKEHGVEIVPIEEILYSLPTDFVGREIIVYKLPPP